MWYFANASKIIWVEFLSPIPPFDVSDIFIVLQLYISMQRAILNKLGLKHKWYFVTKIVLTYCEKKMF